MGWGAVTTLADLRENPPRAASGDAQAQLVMALRWKADTCFIWPFAASNGGTTPVACARGRRINIRRLVCEHVCGPPPSKSVARVRCQKPRCVSPFCVYWCSLADMARERAANFPTLVPKMRAARTPIGKGAFRIALAAARQDPAFVARNMALIAEANKRPERRLQQGAKMKERMTDPDFRAIAIKNLRARP